MSWWSRVANVFRSNRLSREVDEELEFHIEEAVQHGRDPAEARKAFGSTLRVGEESRDFKLLPWLDSLRADTVFGFRQLAKKKVTSAAAILSLGLAIGACTSAFRLIDALLLRPLPVAAPEQLYDLNRHGTGSDGRPETFDGWAYPAFRQMRAAVKDQAELIAISYAEPADVTYKSDQEMEKASLQYVSGWMFNSLVLHPAAGRLFTEQDDLQPGAHPDAVLSHDYWMRRFGGDPSVIGRTFRMASSAPFDADAIEDVYEIVGVAREPFTGTEPGTAIDIFVPTMMHPGVTHDDWTWFRTLARLKPGVAVEPVRAKLDAISYAFELERAKKYGIGAQNKENIARSLAQTLVLEPAAAGASGMQEDYRRSLIALGILVALVLLIASANVANLMTAWAAARARELALRVSIGAGKWRLVQLVLVESSILAFLAAAVGALFAWWSAPFVVSRINPPDNPARLHLPADWRVLGFGLVLTLLVTCLLGLAPALRSSAIRPSSALRGGFDPRSRRRLMHALIALQVAFGFLVLFVAGLFVTTFNRLSHRPTGFSAERVLTLDAVARHARPPVYWEQVAHQLSDVPGVETVALAGWPLLAGGSWNGEVSIDGAPPGPVWVYFLSVSPGWAETMKIPFLHGRDFRDGDTSPGAAIVNQTFVRQFFNGESPIGKLFAKGADHYQVVGVVQDAPYKSIREPILPVAYVPFHRVDSKGALQPIRTATFMVRTSISNPLAIASLLQREVSGAQPEFRVSNIRAQSDLVRAQTIRERLLAMLALFFAIVALLLAGFGLYGVLDYSVLQRRREIGIRMAIGAQAGDIAWRVTVDVFAMVAVGSLAGLALGMGSARYIESLLYQVRATDPSMLALPWLVILAAALLAAVPAVIRAIRIDPVQMLRAE
jgi:putative ABC transport system permease protein